MALSLKNRSDVLPKDLSLELPGSACLLGNTLETASVALSQPVCSFDMVHPHHIIGDLLLVLYTNPPPNEITVNFSG